MGTRDPGLDVLIVEHDAATRKLLQDLARNRQHTVEACADAETGWALAQRNAFALVLLDLELWGKSGTELCRKLRKLGRADEMVVVLTTTGDDREELELALAAGGDDYILKPLTDTTFHVRLGLAERQARFQRDRREAQDLLAQNALRDPHTDCASRTLFIERLEQTRRRARRANRRPNRERGYLYGVLNFNLDNFSELNARLGHEAANAVLRETARRLEDSVRSIDTVSRFTADDFVILLDNLNDVSDPTRVARRIEHGMANLFKVEDQEIRVSGCMGIALNITDSEDPEELLDDARKALVRAKARGPGSYEMFDAVMHARALARLELEGQIRAALDRDEMVLYYQPIVSVTDRTIVGFEALVRWMNPERGTVLPEEFIGVAEETGAIVRLGWWCLDEACSVLSGWIADSKDGLAIFMSVNVSAKQFVQPDAVERIEEALRKTGLEPRSLHLEITETALMTDIQASSRVMQRVKEGSVHLQVDDFGTGYSSLSYLCRFPIDAIKIDRSFIARLTHSGENREVVKTILRLARSLGMAVIAEGVETEKQLQLLRELDCEYAQGYLFSRPLPREEAALLLERPHL